MRLSAVIYCLSTILPWSSCTILQNGQVREDTNYPDTRIPTVSANGTAWKTYGPNATELSYKGRWDSKHISWWA